MASVGTTGTTAVDPLAQIIPLARQYGMWVHVDAAMAGSALLLPEMRWLTAGVEGADSLAWNPHKWLGTVLDCSLLYVADPDHLIRVMSTNPSYLRSAVDGEVTQYKDWGIPLGRRFRALKLWFHLRLDGVEAIRARLRRDLDNARWLAEQVSSTPGWRVLAPVNLQTVVLRHEPAGVVSGTGAVLDADALNAHTLSWVDSVNASGATLVTPSLLDGTWSVRVSIGAEPTERQDVEELWSSGEAGRREQLNTRIPSSRTSCDGVSRAGTDHGVDQGLLLDFGVVLPAEHAELEHGPGDALDVWACPPSRPDIRAALWPRSPGSAGCRIAPWRPGRADVAVGDRLSLLDRPHERGRRLGVLLGPGLGGDVPVDGKVLGGALVHVGHHLVAVFLSRDGDVGLGEKRRPPVAGLELPGHRGETLRVRDEITFLGDMPYASSSTLTSRVPMLLVPLTPIFLPASPAMEVTCEFRRGDQRARARLRVDASARMRNLAPAACAEM